MRGGSGWLKPRFVEASGLYLGDRWESQLSGIEDRWAAASLGEEAPSVRVFGLDAFLRFDGDANAR